MSPFAANLRYLLWKRSPELPRLGYPELVDYVARGCGINPDRFRRLALGHENPEGWEVKAVRDQFSDMGYDLTLMETEDLFAEARKNERDELTGLSIAHLLKEIEYGGHAELTKSLGINASTLFRWKQGTHRPSPAKQAALCRALGLEDSDVLVSGFLFLGLEPVSVRKKKDECKSRIDALDDGTFLELYPALAKLLR